MIKKLMAISISLILFGCGSGNGKQSSKEALGKNIKVSEIKPELITKLNISSGVTEPLNEVKVVTKTGGTVKQVNFKNGDKVKKNQVILVLEDQEIQSSYLKAQATYLSNKADFEIKKKIMKNLNNFLKNN